MSLGYAEKLSYREDLGGQLGAPEIFDQDEALNANAQHLSDMVSTERGLLDAMQLSNGFTPPIVIAIFVQIRDSKTVVVFTGAGISTACGIPDFRCSSTMHQPL